VGQAEMSEENQPKQNTDIELWRERPGDYYADSVFLTKGGGIGMKCGGNVIVRTPRRWQALARENHRLREIVENIHRVMGETLRDMEKDHL
jgi:hypothetical protein